MIHTPSTSRDPVCGMDIEIARSLHSMAYRGLIFHFCSPQCLECFKDNPGLYTGSQRITEIQPIPKKRKLRLAAGDDADIEIACQRVREMMGVSSVDVEKSCLVVKYDLRQATLSQIEAVATDAGVRFKDGFPGFLRGMWKFAERNELDNAAHPSTGACCNRPPAQWR